jgi:hypothetical protein
MTRTVPAPLCSLFHEFPLASIVIPQQMFRDNRLIGA